MTAADRPLLLVDEVLAILPIDKSTLYRLFKAGKMTPLKLGGRTVVRRADLDAFLAHLPVADIKSEVAA